MRYRIIQVESSRMALPPFRALGLPRGYEQEKRPLLCPFAFNGGLLCQAGVAETPVNLDGRAIRCASGIAASSRQMSSHPIDGTRWRTSKVS